MNDENSMLREALKEALAKRKPIDYKLKNQQVLDHGYVEYVDHMGTDLSPLEAARMSTSNPTGVDETKDRKLNDRLWREKHTSPYEMCILELQVQAPLFVVRQMDRHRTISHGGEHDVVESCDDITRKFLSKNEFSGRYSAMEDLFYIPSIDRILGPDPYNKQGSQRNLGDEATAKALATLKDARDNSWKAYEELLGLGVSRETSRMVLQMNQYTRVRLMGSALTWMRFLDLRLRRDVQWETRQYAVAIANVFKSLWPFLWEVFEEHTLYAKTVSCTDLERLRVALGDQASSFKFLADEGDFLKE